MCVVVIFVGIVGYVGIVLMVLCCDVLAVGVEWIFVVEVFVCGIDGLVVMVGEVCVEFGVGNVILGCVVLLFDVCYVYDVVREVVVVVLCERVVAIAMVCGFVVEWEVV